MTDWTFEDMVSHLTPQEVLRALLVRIEALEAKVELHDERLELLRKNTGGAFGRTDL